MKLISQADVVLALGTRLGPFGTLPQHGMDYWPKNAKIIQVDADQKMLGLVKKIAVGICGDAKAVAQELAKRLDGRDLACDATKAERADKIAAEKAAWEKELDEWTHETDPYSLDMIAENAKEKPFSGGEYLHPRQVLRELEKAMPKDVMVSTDIGNINSVAHSYLRFERPRSFFAPMSFGNCGYALPTIIGAKTAAPERPAIAYAGDGAWAMSMMEILTAVRHDIPVTAVVFHNRQWGAEKKNQVEFLQPPLRGGRTGQPFFRRHRPVHGRRRHRGGQAGGRGPGPEARDRHADERRQDLRHRDHVHPRAGRPVPSRRAGQARAPAGEVQGLHLIVTLAWPAQPARRLIHL